MIDVLQDLKSYRTIFEGRYMKVDFGDVRNAILEIERLRAQDEGRDVGAWRPIAEAPTNGTPVLIGWDNRPFEATKAHCEDGLWGILTGDFGFAPCADQPTHFMPLPAGPKRGPECGAAGAGAGIPAPAQ